MTILVDFKKFILRGNVVDLAVGIIIGAAFSKIVNSLVNNIMMPPIGYIAGNTDFNYLRIIIKNGTKPEEEVAIKYGAFIQDCLDFLIIAFCVFILVQLIAKLYKKKQEAPPGPTIQEVLLTEIRYSEIEASSLKTSQLLIQYPPHLCTTAFYVYFLNVQ